MRIRTTWDISLERDEYLERLSELEEYDKKKWIAFDDVEEEVEWLKNEVKQMKLSIILPKIDEAFEDVTK